MDKKRMRAARILDAALAAGVHIEVDHGDLVLEADSPPPDEIVAAVFSVKAAIIALLETQNGIPNSEKCVPLFPERGLTRSMENRPLPEILDVDPYERAITAWLNNNPVVSQPDRCAWCFRLEQPDHAIFPFGVYARGHVWLHGECWEPWQQHRRQMAARALENENTHGQSLVCTGKGLAPIRPAKKQEWAKNHSEVEGRDKP
jgi:hypothetical protein